MDIQEMEWGGGARTVPTWLRIGTGVAISNKVLDLPVPKNAANFLRR